MGQLADQHSPMYFIDYLLGKKGIFLLNGPWYGTLTIMHVNSLPTFELYVLDD